MVLYELLSHNEPWKDSDPMEVQLGLGLGLGPWKDNDPMEVTVRPGSRVFQEKGLTLTLTLSLIVGDWGSLPRRTSSST